MDAGSPEKLVADDKDHASKVDDAPGSRLDVWWDEPADRDPANPMNWPSGTKWLNILTVAFISFLVPFVSSMLAPAVPMVMREFDTSSDTFATFVVSIFVLGFACGPLVLAPLSELYGRVPVYHATNVLFAVFILGCGLSNGTAMLLAFRFLSGFVGVATITIGSGTIADLMPREQRGRAVSMWSVGTILGPMVGPVVGGRVAEAAGWRWLFYALAIVSAVVTVFGFFVFRETYAVVILEKKAARLRRETGNPHYRSRLDADIPPAQLFARAIVRPSKLLTRCPMVTVICLYVAALYGTLYLLFATFAFVFGEVYGFSTFESGLVFLPGGIGTLIGVVYVGQVSDWTVRRRMATGKQVTPEDRLPLLITLPGALTFPIGMFMYGWGVEGRVHWAFPLIGTAVLDFGSILIFIGIQTYYIDAFEGYAASAVGANAVLRGLAGAFLPLSGLGLYRGLGWGWGNSLLALVTLVGVPVPLVIGMYGGRIRAMKCNQVQL